MPAESRPNSALPSASLTALKYASLKRRIIHLCHRKLCNSMRKMPMVKMPEGSCYSTAAAKSGREWGGDKQRRRQRQRFLLWLSEATWHVTRACRECLQHLPLLLLAPHSAALCPASKMMNVPMFLARSSSSARWDSPAALSQLIPGLHLGKLLASVVATRLGLVWFGLAKVLWPRQVEFIFGLLGNTWCNIRMQLVVVSQCMVHATPSATQNCF